METLMDLTETQHNALIAMLQHGVNFETADAYPASSGWGRDKDETSLDGDRVRLSKADGKVLADAGLVEHVTSGTVHYKLTPAGVAHALPHVEWTPLDIEAALGAVFDTAYFHPVEEIDGAVPIPHVYKPSASGSKLILVLGENAGGKSFFRRLFSLITRRERTDQYGRVTKGGPHPVGEFIHLSMEERTKTGFASAMIYGTEEWRSTGENSTDTVDKGIQTASKRTHTSILHWDEPDIGMGNAAAAGAGLEIHGFIAADDAPLVQAVVVTSHNTALLRQLAPLDPHYVYLGADESEGAPADLDAWFVSQENPVPVRPQELKARSHRRFKMIQAVLNRKKR